MNALELFGNIDEHHRLHVDIPTDVPVGRVRIILLLADQDDSGISWPRRMATESTADLADAAQDRYTQEDGEPVRE